MYIRSLLPKFTTKQLSRFYASTNRPQPVELSYSVIGNPRDFHKPPILILHGLLGKKKNYRSVGKVLKKILQCCIIPVDLRNHGNSPHASPHNYEALASDVIKLYEKLSIKKAAIIGHSMGGRTAMTVALMEPSLVPKLVIIDISPVSSPKQLSEFFRELLILMKNIDLSQMKTAEIAKREVRKQLLPIVKDDMILNAVTMNIQKKDNKIGWLVNLDVLVNEFQNIVEFPKSLMNNTFSGPTLFIGGQLSEFLPPDDINAIRSMFPQAVVKYVPKVGHNVHVENTAAFLELTISFLR